MKTTSTNENFSFQNQEAFIRMINETEGEEGGEAGGERGLDQPGVIQVSPQDKEAIERVSILSSNFMNEWMIHLLLKMYNIGFTFMWENSFYSEGTIVSRMKP